MLKISSGNKPVKISVSSGNSKVNINSLGNSSEYYANLSRAWAISEETVQGLDFSAKYYAQQAKTNAEDSYANLSLVTEEGNRQVQIINNKKNEFLEQVNNIVTQSEQNLADSNNLIVLARQTVQEGVTGLAWKSFEEEDWVLNSGIYTLELDIPVAIGVYNENKILVTNINIQMINDKTIITSLNAFDGFVITAKSNVEDEDNNEFSQDELEAITIVDWDDV